MACPKMLIEMDQNRALFGNARADPICTLGLLRPDTSDPEPPFLKLVGSGHVGAVMNRHTFGVTQQNDVPFLPYDRKQTINLFLSRNDCLRKRLAVDPEFAIRYDMGT